jgi:hypothetical protein
MLLLNVYWGAKSGQVLVPTMAQTEAGFWLEVDPVERADTSDLSSIASALQRCASRGNPRVPTPPRSAFPEWVVLKHSNKKRLRDFENEFGLLSIEQSHGDSYLIRNHPRSKDGRGYEPDLVACLTLCGGSTFFEIASGLKSAAD